VILALLGRGVMDVLAARRTEAIDVLSAALCGLGVYWFLQRLYF